MKPIYLIMVALCLMLIVVPFVDAKQSKAQKRITPTCKTLDNMEVGWNYFNFTLTDKTYYWEDTYFEYKKVRKNLTEAYNAGWIGNNPVASSWIMIYEYNVDDYGFFGGNMILAYRTYKSNNSYAAYSNLNNVKLLVCK